MSEVAVRMVREARSARDAARAERDEARSALRQIAHLYPLPDCCAQKADDVHGINDGKSRGILLAAALDIARTALGLPTEPRREE